MSEFSLISFVGISDFWVAFEVSKFESSFIVSFMLPDCNEKLVACFVLNFIFFKYSYVLQNFLFNAGSVSNWERFGRLIFKFAQYSPNRLFQQFQILLKLLYHFQQVFFLLWFNFSVKLRFISYLMNIEIIQKQPSRGVLKKRCFENMQQIYRSNFIEIKLRHRCSPVNLLRIFRTPFPKNTSGRLLL